MNPPTIDDLIFANKNIKRRLFSEFKGDNFVLIDGRGKEIEAKPFGFPVAIRSSVVEDPTKGSRFEKRPYLFGFSTEGSRIRFVNRYETQIIFGTDYRKEETIDGIGAMLEACNGGPGLANAYFLGGTHGFGELKHPYVIIPVQYYQIDKKRAESLALTEKEIAKFRKLEKV